jgi:hypothetical protein
VETARTDGESVEGRAFHQFDAIAEGVENVRAAEAADRRVGAGGQTRAFACGDDLVEVIDGECGVRASSGVKIGVGFDAEMQIYGTGHEPDAVASGQRGRLLLFGKTEDADVERASSFFATSGDSYLHVIEAKDRHRVIAELGRRRPKEKRRSSYRAVLRRGTSRLQAEIRPELGICSGAWRLMKIRFDSGGFRY